MGFSIVCLCLRRRTPLVLRYLIPATPTVFPQPSLCGQVRAGKKPDGLLAEPHDIIYSGNTVHGCKQYSERRRRRQWTVPIFMQGVLQPNVVELLSFAFSLSLSFIPRFLKETAEDEAKIAELVEKEIVGRNLLGAFGPLLVMAICNN